MRHWCVRRRVNISRDIGSTVGKPRDPSASIVTLPTQTNAWTDANEPARRSAKPCCLFSPSFFPLSPFSLSALARLSSLPSLFCSLPTLFSPLSRLLLLIFSHLPPPTPLPSLLAPVSCSTRLPPVRRVWCLVFFVPLKRFRGLNLFQVCILIYTRVKLKRVRFDSTAGII